MTSASAASSLARGRGVIDAIGRTPLFRLTALEDPVGNAELYAKAEWFNPGGSVKDRPAARMICEAIQSGQLTPDKRILDATSGNTGIAYAMLGAAMGYAVTLCVPTNVTPERKRILQAYGPELVFTDPLEGSDGAIREARRRYAAEPERYFYPDQYSNDFNWRAHYDGTAREIWDQTGGRVTHFIAGLGTSGTFVGTARRLKELKPDIVTASVQPDSPFHGLEGMKHMESALVPAIYDPAVADHDVRVSTDDAYALTRRLATDAGLLVGISSGACLAGARELLRAEGGYGESAVDPLHPRPASERAAVVVMIFPDGGERYLSEQFWSQSA